MRDAIGAVLAAALAISAGVVRAQQTEMAHGPDGAYARLAVVCRAKAPAAVDPPAASTPVTVRVLQPIVPVPATDGFVHLAYAAQVTNLLREPAVIEAITPVEPLAGNRAAGTNSVRDDLGADITGKVRLFDPGSSRTLGSGTPGAPGATDFGRMPGGASGTTFFDVRFARPEDVPRLLAHRIAIRFGNPPQHLVGLSDPFPVDCRPPVVLAPPLTGSGWWNGNGCCEVVAPHRGATLPLNGGIRVPEGFAIDFVRLGPRDACCAGPVKDLASWPFFGAPILAAADGTIVAMVADMPEQVPGPPVGVTVANAAGNHVIEDIGEGRFILYAHLRTGSIPAGLKVGSRIKVGEKIGELGNSGSTTAPHLHFQVMDRPSALNASGLPFVFARQRLEGSVTGTMRGADQAFEAGKPVTVDRRTPGIQRFRMPAEGQVFGY